MKSRDTLSAVTYIQLQILYHFRIVLSMRQSSQSSRNSLKTYLLQSVNSWLYHDAAAWAYSTLNKTVVIVTIYYYYYFIFTFIFYPGRQCRDFKNYKKRVKLERRLIRLINNQKKLSCKKTELKRCTTNTDWVKSYQMVESFPLSVSVTSH